MLNQMVFQDGLSTRLKRTQFTFKLEFFLPDGFVFMLLGHVHT